MKSYHRLGENCRDADEQIFREHNFPDDEKLCHIASNLIIATCDGLRRKFTKIVALNLIILETVI